MAKSPIGFGREFRADEDQEEIKRLFTPEFRNRLDAVVPFTNLKPETVARVVDKFIMQMEAQLADRNVTIELSPDARAWLARTGYDPAMGARPLSRIIQEKVKRPLAEELLFGKLSRGGLVRVAFKPGEDGNEGALTFDFIEERSKKAAAATEETTE
jgi:ATP-dependent Clp protease ATP-binding subunit ClpA